MYPKYIKRLLDFILSLIGLIMLLPIYFLIAILVKIKLGSPVIFKQKRPGKNQKIFTLYKFRTMKDEKNQEGELLSDEERLTNFGKFLRSTSLDELPELVNILKGDMSIIGPRPQLVRDMVFMNEEQNKRHLVRQGLTGLAQVSGRNAISWEDKFKYDLEYMDKITFLGDVKIFFLTIKKVFAKEDISAEGMETAEDFGDYLLRTNQITQEEYDEKQTEALELLEGNKQKERKMLTQREKNEKKVSLIVPVYNEEKYIQGFMESILSQDYDFNDLEIIFIDGNSTDKTVEMIENTLNEKEKINYRILMNPRKITPISLNIGIKAAQNNIIVRLDAHSQYPSNYVSKCVYYINNVDADNVGCAIQTKSTGTVGNAISSVLSSKFGVGNSDFRTNGKSGYVDTVPFGTFHKELFEKIGYFDERLERNQDIELNHRILKNGGKIYMFHDIQLTYHPRDTIGKLVKMALTSGKWNLYTNYLVPGSLKLRHFVPFAFVISLLVGILGTILKIGWIKGLFGIEIIVYLLLDLLFSFKDAKEKSLRERFLCLIIYPIFHSTYGIGTFLGIFFILRRLKK